MKISLSPALQKLIVDKVKSGRYHSADEVVREGLKLLREREKEASRPALSATTNFAPVFENIAGEVPDADWKCVPADLSKNLDHYLYGGQKSS